MAASSAKNRQSSQPVRVMKTVIGMPDAPSWVTITGAIPVTRIVPARPMTKAPHQPVSRLRPPEAYCNSSEALVCLGSAAMTSPLTLHAMLMTTLTGNKVSCQSHMYASNPPHARLLGKHYLAEEQAVADEIVRYRKLVI